MTGTSRVSLPAAMKIFESGRLEDAEKAFAALAGDAGDAVIARFRQAECLSRLGRHDEAVDVARLAAAAAPDRPPAPLWLAQTLAEAGRLDEAAAVELPVEGDPELQAIQDGFVALARLPAGAGDDAAEVASAIQETRHQPLYSLALRTAEARRLASDQRAPDLVTSYLLCCALGEADDLRNVQVHPDLPLSPNEKEDASIPRFVRLLELTGGWTQTYPLLKKYIWSTGDKNEDAFEAALLMGQLDEAEKALAKLVAEDGKHPSAEACILATRLAQLRGQSMSPSQSPGFERAKTKLRPWVDWLLMTTALMDDRPLDAREAADRVSDPSHADYVTSSLYRWAVTREPTPQAAAGSANPEHPPV